MDVTIFELIGISFLVLLGFQTWRECRKGMKRSEEFKKQELIRQVRSIKTRKERGRLYLL